LSGSTSSPTEEPRPLPPVISRLLRGTFWLALRTPLQAVFVLCSVPLIVHTVGKKPYGAFGFAWGFGFFQFLLEFGMGSAIQKEVSACWTRGDRQGVDRAVACGLNFYAVVALIQAAALLGVAYFGIPSEFSAESHTLIVKLLWLQALTAPCYGLSMVISAVLGAARRYEVVPKFEFAVVILRFVILAVGLKSGYDLFTVVAAQTVVSVALSLGPAWWVMRRELGYTPSLRGAKLADYASLMHISTFMFLLQLSVVLADKIDTTILGYGLRTDPESGEAIYQAVSKPFLQLRQTGWMLSYLVMPAVASLAAARDEAGLERIKYDGTRLLVALVLPVGLLAAIYAHPFLELWVPEFAPHYRLMQLFLIAALPLVLSVLVQMAIGMNAVKVVALSALAGAIVNLPVSYFLTVRLGVSGVIWGTVLTTLVSNLLVPGIHVFRVLGVRLGTFVRRSLGAPLAGAALLVAASLAMRAAWSPEPGAGSLVVRAWPLVAHLSVAMIAYFVGYLAVPEGRGDGNVLAARLGWRKN
jgi:O-antigen/teichoic acid export membrane protein